MKTRAVFSILILSMLSGCKDEPMFLFEGDDAVIFTYTVGREQDSVSYSFKFNPVVKERDTVWLSMRLVGQLSDKPRKIGVIADSSSTAIAGQHYMLPDFEFPADTFAAKYPVVIFNTVDIANKAVRLVLRIADTEDLKVGPPGTTGTTTRFKINFSGDLIRPDYWGYISPYIGGYSKVRFQFMINEFGHADFRPDTKGGIIGYPQWINIKVRLRNALDAYVKVHGDLIDENGAKVEFPL